MPKTWNPGRLGWAALLVAFVLGAYAHSYFANGGPSVLSRLELGMSREAVVDKFGEPDHSCAFGLGQVVYYFGDALHDDSHLHAFLSCVATKEELPNVYEAAQILLDTNGEVVAFTWNGEGAVIWTVDGDYPGGHLSNLPDAFLAKHAAMQDGEPL